MRSGPVSAPRLRLRNKLNNVTGARKALWFKYFQDSPTTRTNSLRPRNARVKCAGNTTVDARTTRRTRARRHLVIELRAPTARPRAALRLKRGLCAARIRNSLGATFREDEHDDHEPHQSDGGGPGPSAGDDRGDRGGADAGRTAAGRG